MDDHTKIVIAGLMMYTFEGANWDFDKLNHSEQRIVGNQVQLDILRKFCNNEFKKAIVL